MSMDLYIWYRPTWAKRVHSATWWWHVFWLVKRPEVRGVTFNLTIYTVYLLIISIWFYRIWYRSAIILWVFTRFTHRWGNHSRFHNFINHICHAVLHEIDNISDILIYLGHIVHTLLLVRKSTFAESFDKYPSVATATNRGYLEPSELGQTFYMFYSFICISSWMFGTNSLYFFCLLMHVSPEHPKCPLYETFAFNTLSLSCLQ